VSAMKKKIILTVIIIVAIIVLVAVIMVKRANSNLENLAGLPLGNVDLEAVSDGKYSGSYTAFPVSAVVAVTVENHQITRVDLIEHSHGQGAPGEAVIDRVLQDQSLQVDLVSGATYSSKVILLAIEDALNRLNKE